MHLAVGLGNPGQEYALTRHNLGFRVVDQLAHRLGIPLESFENLYLLGMGALHQERIGLAKPLTFMNASGRAALHLRERFQLQLDEMLFICDDTNLPLGKIRLRRGGSAGGHRGLDSVILHLASEDFPRLRLGIGGSPEDKDLVTFVLEEFLPDEEGPAMEMIQWATDAALCFFQEGIEAAMNQFNG